MTAPDTAPDATPASARSPELFVQLLTGVHDQLLGYLISLLGNRHDAEDVLQLASLTMWRKFETFAPGTNFVGWAAAVALNETRDFRRRKLRSRLYFDEQLMETLARERAADLAQTDSRLDALESCLSELDAAGRELIEAAYKQGASLVNLARDIGRAPQTLYNRLNLLRRMLADCVEQRLAEAPEVIPHSHSTAPGASSCP